MSDLKEPMTVGMLIALLSKHDPSWWVWVTEDDPYEPTGYRWINPTDVYSCWGGIHIE